MIEWDDRERDRIIKEGSIDFFLSLLPNRVNPDPIVPAWFVKRQLLFSIVVSYYRIEEWALT